MDQQQTRTTKNGKITGRCPAGHTKVVPDKGLGRATLATWETRHQTCTAAEGENATVTVSYGGQSVTFALDGAEVSRTPQDDGSIHAYLNNASRGFIADEVEKALIALTAEQVAQS